jgi:hypothetical protein
VEPARKDADDLGDDQSPDDPEEEQEQEQETRDHATGAFFGAAGGAGRGSDAWSRLPPPHPIDWAGGHTMDGELMALVETGLTGDPKEERARLDKLRKDPRLPLVYMDVEIVEVEVEVEAKVDRKGVEVAGDEESGADVGFDAWGGEVDAISEDRNQEDVDGGSGGRTESDEEVSSRRKILDPVTQSPSHTNPHPVTHNQKPTTSNRHTCHPHPATHA